MVSDKMFTLGVPSVFQLTSHVFRSRHYHLLSKIIKVNSDFVFNYPPAEFSSAGIFGFVFELTSSGSGCLWVTGVK